MRCSICPRNCETERGAENAAGYCHSPALPRTGRIDLHFYEEPSISGTSGSGAVFFTGCNMACVFCQNRELQSGAFGRAQTVESLSDAYLALQKRGAHNINLVTPAPHVMAIRDSLLLARENGLSIPVVYNTNAYEKAETLRLLEGLVDIYLPDFKYITPELSARFSDALDYAIVAEKAISEMARQVGQLSLDADGIAKRGVLVRHLVLPACVFDTRLVLDKLYSMFGAELALSLMSQYAPTENCVLPPLNRKLTEREYDRAVDYALSLGFTRVYIQDLSAASLAFTPIFSKM